MVTTQLHTATVTEVHVIHPFDGRAYEAVCHCGFRSSTYRKRKDAELHARVHVENEAARDAAQVASA